MDLRPLQDPDRAPLTSTYLEGLLGALEADPVPGESFSFLLASDLDDPTSRWPGLRVVGRRLLPPTRFLRSAALTVDPVLLRGASLGAGWRAEGSGAAGTVYYAAAGALPIASRIPVVATLLDLAPWELKAAYQRGAMARFGQRIRGQQLREAAAVIVPSQATAADARRLLRIRRDRLRVVGLAPRAMFRPEAADGATEPAVTHAGLRHGFVEAAGAAAAPGAAARHEAERLGLAERYAIYAGRYDARQDLRTLLDALAILAAEGPTVRGPEGPARRSSRARTGSTEPGEGGGPQPPAGPAAPIPSWPPRVCLVGASPDDRAALSRSAVRAGVGELLAYAPRLPDARLAALVAGARFLVLPVRSEASGLSALEALASGVPVVASAVGALPEIVGRAGILVEPGDARRLATALRAAWSDDVLHASLVAAAERTPATRTWADVARETRAVWAEVARPAPLL